MRKFASALLLAVLLPACGDEGVDVFLGAVLTEVFPASPNTSQLPAFRGSAAPGALVELFTNPAATGAPVATGTATSSGTFELVPSVARPSQRTYYAFATPPRAPRSGPSNGLLYASRLGGFQAPAPYAVGLQSLLLAAGDFNGDTKLDLAVTAASSNNVTILLGNGDGTFTPGVAPPGIGSGAAGIAAADFDGDLDLDLAVSNSNDNTLSILLGNGDGTFTPAAGSPISVGNAPFSAVIADVNGGPLDLLVAHFFGPGLSILLGNGDGTFTPAAGSTVPAAGRASTPAAADFDGDGRLDVAVPQVFAASALLVFLGDGAGGFSAGPGAVPATGAEPLFAGAADFDGDGRLDLVSSDRASDQLSFFLGSGAGAFGTGTPLAVGDAPFGQVIADFNGDGVPDVAVVCGAGLVDVLLGR